MMTVSLTKLPILFRILTYQSALTRVSIETDGNVNISHTRLGWLSLEELEDVAPLTFIRVISRGELVVKGVWPTVWVALTLSLWAGLHVKAPLKNQGVDRFLVVGRAHDEPLNVGILEEIMRGKQLVKSEIVKEEKRAVTHLVGCVSEVERFTKNIDVDPRIKVSLRAILIISIETRDLRKEF